MYILSLLFFLFIFIYLFYQKSLFKVYLFRKFADKCCGQYADQPDQPLNGEINAPVKVTLLKSTCYFHQTCWRVMDWEESCCVLFISKSQKECSLNHYSVNWHIFHSSEFNAEKWQQPKKKTTHYCKLWYRFDRQSSCGSTLSCSCVSLSRRASLSSAALASSPLCCCSACVCAPSFSFSATYSPHSCHIVCVNHYTFASLRWGFVINHKIIRYSTFRRVNSTDLS